MWNLCEARSASRFFVSGTRRQRRNMNAKHFSVNRSQVAIVVIGGVLLLGLFFFLAASHLRISATGETAVDWSDFSPRCSVNNPNCKSDSVAVDWTSGSSRPCHPTDPNCKSRPVAVDWTSGETQACPPGARQCAPKQVAVDWSSKSPED